MPELPEVENLRRGLERSVVGQKIKKVIVHKPKLVSGKGTIRSANKKKVQEFIVGLTGETFISIERRAKNLLFKLSGDKLILAHLKMSGQFAYEPTKGKKIMGGHPIELSENSLPNKHSHIIFELTGGTLYYNDIRMFGYALYFPSSSKFEKENHFGEYGAEPFSAEFSLSYFSKALKNKKSKIKSVLMGQDIVTGVGNIYADESLFEARISPVRSADSLTKEEIKKLHKAIVRIMKKATEVGGSSVATYRLIDKSKGNYAREHKVYGKSGKMCTRCGKPLKTIQIQSRTTVFCPNCQS